MLLNRIGLPPLDLGEHGSVKSGLEAAVLTQADLRGANLEGADLSEADLSGADLRGADLRGANLSGADLSGANLRWANLRGADLRWADLSGANLRGANLRGANPSGADLSGADLRWANLSGADLRWADLSEADLIEADLSEADLRWADLSMAALSGALGLPVPPRIDAIDSLILGDIEAGGNLEMAAYHACNSTHCRAGWAIHKAGPAGYDLEARWGSSVAGALIYAASRPNQRVPDFYASNAAALADLRACAGRQDGGKAE